MRPAVTPRARPSSRIAPLAALVLLCATAPIGATTPSAPADPEVRTTLSQPLSLSQCVQLAEQSEPVLLSQRAQIQEAAALVEQARTLPNPSLSYVAQDLGLQGPSGPQLLHQAMVGVAPFAALLRIQEVRAASAGRNQAVAAAQAELQQLRAAVGRAFYELLLLEKLHLVEQEAVALATELVAETQTQKQHGEASGLEVLRAQAEQLDAQRGAEWSAHQRELAQRAFSILLGAATPQPIQILAEDPATAAQLPPRLQQVLAQVPGSDVDASTAALVRAALIHQPALLQHQAAQRQATELARLSTLRTLPLSDLQVAGGVRVAALGVGGVVALTGMLPLLDWNVGPRHRAQAQGLRAQARELAVQRQLALEVESSYRDFLQAHKLRVQRVQPLCELRTRVLAAVRKQFAEGVVSLLEVVSAQRDLLAVQRVLYQLERDALVARWRLAVAVDDW